MHLPSISPDALGLQIPRDSLTAQGVRIVDASPLIQDQIERYHFPKDLFADLIFLQPNKKLLRAAARPLEIPQAPHIDRIGIDLLRIDMKAPRLTTAAAMTWGHLAQKNAIELQDDQLDPYLLRENIRLSSEQLHNCTGRGPILIRYHGHCLGLGFLESTRPEDSNHGHLRSLYPRAFARELQLAQVSALGNPL